MEAMDLGSLTKYGSGSSVGIPTRDRHAQKGSSFSKNALDLNTQSESMDYQPTTFRDATVRPMVGVVTLLTEKRDPLTSGLSDEPLPRPALGE